MRVLLTGATGFVGRALLHRLLAGREVVAAVRSTSALLPAGTQRFVLAGGLEQPVCWASAMCRVDVVIHAAARVHILAEPQHDPLAAYRHVNVEATLNLARQAASAGVKRFVFISSVKVCGEQTFAGARFIADMQPSPGDSYGLSKMEAEQLLQRLAADTGMELVIIRPPLVYGPGVKANFLSMMRALACGIPLPFGAIDNRRSLVALDNLVDLIITCIEHPDAANQVFLVSDDEDLSTTDLLCRLGRALGKPARLLPVPAGWLETGAALFGRSELARRLCGSLQVDIGKTRTLLGWMPPVSVEAALALTARHYLEHRKK